MEAKYKLVFLNSHINNGIFSCTTYEWPLGDIYKFVIKNYTILDKKEKKISIKYKIKSHNFWEVSELFTNTIDLKNTLTKAIVDPEFLHFYLTTF